MDGCLYLAATSQPASVDMRLHELASIYGPACAGTMTLGRRTSLILVFPVELGPYASCPYKRHSPAMGCWLWVDANVNKKMCLFRVRWSSSNATQRVGRGIRRGLCTIESLEILQHSTHQVDDDDGSQEGKELFDLRSRSVRRRTESRLMVNKVL